MITCKKCGTEVEDDNTICPNCGENLTNDNTNNELMNDKTQIFKGGIINNQEEPTAEEPATEEPAVEEPATEPTIEPAVEEPTTEPTVEETTSEPTIQSFDNNVANPNIQSFDNNVANPNIQSFDNNVANPNIQSFDNNASAIATNMGQKKDNKIIIIAVAVAVVVIAAIVLLLPIFNSKTIECSKEETQNGIGIKTEIKTNYNGNKINAITLKASYTLTEQYKQYADVFYNSIKSEAKSYEKINGVKVTTDKKDNEISFSVTADRKGAEKIFETQFNDKDESPSSFIKAAEAQGMTCKK